MGQYDFDEANRREQIFVAQWGQEMLEYTKERMSQGKNIPPMMQEYYKAREVLKKYWEVRSWAERTFGTPKTEWQERRINSTISKIRKRLRLGSPEMEKYYQLFYVR